MNVRPQASVNVTVSLSCDLEFSSTAPATVYGAISTARAGRATRSPSKQRPAAIQTSRRRAAN